MHGGRTAGIVVPIAPHRARGRWTPCCRPTGAPGVYCADRCLEAMPGELDEAAGEASYQELCAYTLAHRDPAFIHQHVVDAYAAQRADHRSKAVGVAFALIGLYLHVERGVSGRDVQRVHVKLAARRRTWPTFALPSDRGEMTVADVMRAAPGPDRDAAIHQWCEVVWAAWKGSRARVIGLLESSLP